MRAWRAHAQEIVGWRKGALAPCPPLACPTSCSKWWARHRVRACARPRRLCPPYKFPFHNDSVTTPRNGSAEYPVRRSLSIPSPPPRLRGRWRVRVWCAHAQSECLPTTSSNNQTSTQTRNSQTHLRASRRDAPEGLPETSAPLEQRARGNAGCPVHPQPRVRKVAEKCARVFTASSPDQPGIPAHDGFTAYIAISPVIELYLSPSPRGLTVLSAPG